MISKIIKTKKNCLCGNKLYKNISFGSLPIINKYTSFVSKKYPTIISICKKCYLVQLKKVINDKYIFPKNYPYKSGDSNEKLQSFNQLAKEINKNFKKKGNKILDIGSNDGSFLNIAKKKGFKTLGVEPTNVADIANKKYIKTLKSNYNKKTAKYINKQFGCFDIILSTNFFAHTNSLNEILNGIHINLKDNGVLIIEIQYFYTLLKKNGFDSIHQDHKFYYTASSISKILKHFNFYVYDIKKINLHGEILRVYAKKSRCTQTKSYKKILKQENDKKIVLKIEKLNNFRLKFIKTIFNFIKKIKKNNCKIYGIGAAPRSCVLINSIKLSKRQINFIGEVNNSLKINKYLPGTNILIKNEKIIIKDQPDYVIVLPWHLRERIIKNLRSKGFRGKFIIPLPKFKILS